MMYVINIVTPTKEGDSSYHKVAINTFPIVWFTEGDDFSILLNDPDFNQAMTNLVRSKKVYDNAIVYYRSFNDYGTLIKEDRFKLKDQIKIELK